MNEELTQSKRGNFQKLAPDHEWVRWRYPVYPEQFLWCMSAHMHSTYVYVHFRCLLIGNSHILPMLRITFPSGAVSKRKTVSPSIPWLSKIPGFKNALVLQCGLGQRNMLPVQRKIASETEMYAFFPFSVRFPFYNNLPPFISRFNFCWIRNLALLWKTYYCSLIAKEGCIAIKCCNVLLLWYNDNFWVAVRLLFEIILQEISNIYMINVRTNL